MIFLHGTYGAADLCDANQAFAARYNAIFGFLPP